MTLWGWLCLRMVVYRPRYALRVRLCRDELEATMAAQEPISAEVHEITGWIVARWWVPKSLELAVLTQVRPLWEETERRLRGERAMREAQGRTVAMELGICPSNRCEACPFYRGRGRKCEAPGGECFNWEHARR